MRTALFLLTLLPLSSPAALAWNPETPAFIFNAVPRGELRGFVNWNHFSAMLETAGRLEAGGIQNTTITAGTYFHPVGILRAGLFYRRQWGVRHDTDWSFNGTQWVWNSVNGRGEDVLIADVTARMDLPFLPALEWLGELRLRYLFNPSATEHTLLVRPALRAFIREEGIPVWQFFGEFEAYFPLNYGRTAIYETWTYVGALRSITPWMFAGVSAALRSRNWASTAFYTANTTPASTFVSTEWSTLIGANLVFQIDVR